MPTDEQYREKARAMHSELSNVDIDASNVVERGGDGAWVKISVWVSDEEFDNENGQFGVGA